ncbi:MAG: hypothetical protein ACR2RE_20150 [Geminicoccaceae bacterium]
MVGLIREVQLANLLGYTEMADFRRALKAGQVPAPAGYLAGKRKAYWVASDIESWLGAVLKRKKKDDFLGLIEDM